jgi:hypothetical protein
VVDESLATRLEVIDELSAYIVINDNEMSENNSILFVYQKKVFGVFDVFGVFWCF